MAAGEEHNGQTRIEIPMIREEQQVVDVVMPFKRG